MRIKTIIISALVLIPLHFSLAFVIICPDRLITDLCDKNKDTGLITVLDETTKNQMRDALPLSVKNSKKISFINSILLGRVSNDGKLITSSVKTPIPVTVPLTAGSQMINATSVQNNSFTVTFTYDSNGNVTVNLQDFLKILNKDKEDCKIINSKITCTK